MSDKKSHKEDLKNTVGKNAYQKPQLKKFKGLKKVMAAFSDVGIAQI